MSTPNQPSNSQASLVDVSEVDSLASTMDALKLHSPSKPTSLENKTQTPSHSMFGSWNDILLPNQSPTPKRNATQGQLTPDVNLNLVSHNKTKMQEVATAPDSKDKDNGRVTPQCTAVSPSPNHTTLFKLPDAQQTPLSPSWSQSARSGSSSKSQLNATAQPFVLSSFNRSELATDDDVDTFILSPRSSRSARTMLSPEAAPFNLKLQNKGGSPRSQSSGSTRSLTLSATATPFTSKFQPRGGDAVSNHSSPGEKRITIRRSASPPSFYSNADGNPTPNNVTYHQVGDTLVPNVATTLAASDLHDHPFLASTGYGGGSGSSEYAIGIAQNEPSPRVSRAVKITPPPAPSKLTDSKTEKSPSTPSEWSQPPTKSNFSQATRTSSTSTETIKSPATILQRRGKAEILSLYALSNRGPGASPRSAEKKASPLKTQNSLDLHNLPPLPVSPLFVSLPSHSVHASSPSMSRLPTSASAQPGYENEKEGQAVTEPSPHSFPDHPQFEAAEPALADLMVVSVESDSVGSASIAGSTLQEVTEELAELAVKYDRLQNAMYNLIDNNSGFHGAFDEAKERIASALKSHSCDPVSQPDEGAGFNTVEKLYRVRIKTLQIDLDTLKQTLDKEASAKAATQVVVKKLTSRLEEAEQAKREAQGLNVALHEKIEQLMVERDTSQLCAEEAYKNIAKTHAQDTKARKSLAKRYLILQDEYNKLKTEEDVDFVTIFLHGEANMFDLQLLSRGYDGGGKMAMTIIEEVKILYRLAHNDAEVEPVMSMSLLLDIPKVARQLQLPIAHLREFCDGFQSHHDLCSVCDVERDIEKRIIQNMKLSLSCQGCKMVFLATQQAQPYLAFLKDQRHSPRVYFARSSPSVENDPFKSLGNDRLLYLSCLFPSDPMVKPQQGQLSYPAVWESSSISPPSSVTSNVTVRPPSPMEPPAVVQRRNSAQGGSQPPWLQNVPALTADKDQVTAPSSDAGATRQLLRQRSVTTPKATRLGMMNMPPSPPSPTHPHLQHHAEELVVKMTPEEGSIGGSPPESDEDEPSVHLPHSAQRHVQRPVPIETSSVYDSTSERDGTSVFSSTLSSKSGSSDRTDNGSLAYSGLKRLGEPPSRLAPANVSSRRLSFKERMEASARPPMSLKERITAALPSTSQSSQAPSVSGSNSTPLGLGPTRYQSSGASSPYDLKARRRTSEYQFLQSLDPRPCHRLYLEGKCFNRRCAFGHDYTLLLKQVDMLRQLAKEMNCEKVNPGVCTVSADKCLYSHRCPYGLGCELGTKCWFNNTPGGHDPI